MKRFYTHSTAGYRAGGFGVMLDQKYVRTPQGKDLILPNGAVALAIAQEFAEQSGDILPHTMPVMQCASSVIDRVQDNRDYIYSELLSFAGGDAICYWAGKPDELRAREKSRWGKLLDMLQTQGMTFHIVLGLGRVEQPQESLDIISRHARSLDSWRLYLWLYMTNLTGSVLAGYLWVRGEIDGEELFQAGFLPEIFRCELANDPPKESPNLIHKWQDIVYADRCLRLLQESAQAQQAEAIMHGKVQGVGYRAWCVQSARKRGLGGWVRNCPDGTVQAVFTGSPQIIADQLQDCLKGPMLAKVEYIEIPIWQDASSHQPAEFEQR